MGQSWAGEIKEERTEEIAWVKWRESECNRQRKKERKERNIILIRGRIINNFFALTFKLQCTAIDGYAL